ncbi:MAG: TraR/DksA family transcriptional regulator [Candidatus Pacebacteria bacterium]|nr:TraR/DksA family transcriptional regulator [Candidatus Paceibacterota bacterium]
MSEEKHILDKVTLETIKQELLDRKSKILEDLEDISQEDSHEADNRSAKFPEYGDKPDENAQEVSEYSTTLATEKILEKTLEDIDKALKRIEKGQYGTCKYCGDTINPKRLLARPIASSCISCKNKLQNS